MSSADIALCARVPDVVACHSFEVEWSTLLEAFSEESVKREEMDVFVHPSCAPEQRDLSFKGGSKQVLRFVTGPREVGVSVSWNATTLLSHGNLSLPNGIAQSSLTMLAASGYSSWKPSVALVTDAQSKSLIGGILAQMVNTATGGFDTIGFILRYLDIQMEVYKYLESVLDKSERDRLKAAVATILKNNNLVEFSAAPKSKHLAKSDLAFEDTNCVYTLNEIKINLDAAESKLYNIVYSVDWAASKSYRNYLIGSDSSTMSHLANIITMLATSSEFGWLLQYYDERLVVSLTTKHDYATTLQFMRGGRSLVDSLGYDLAVRAKLLHQLEAGVRLADTIFLGCIPGTVEEAAYIPHYQVRLHPIRCVSWALQLDLSETSLYEGEPTFKPDMFETWAILRETKVTALRDGVSEGIGVYMTQMLPAVDLRAHMQFALNMDMIRDQPVQSTCWDFLFLKCEPVPINKYYKVPDKMKLDSSFMYETELYVLASKQTSVLYSAGTQDHVEFEGLDYMYLDYSLPSTLSGLQQHMRAAGLMLKSNGAQVAYRQNGGLIAVNASKYTAVTAYSLRYETSADLKQEVVDEVGEMLDAILRSPTRYHLFSRTYCKVNSVSQKRGCSPPCIPVRSSKKKVNDCIVKRLTSFRSAKSTASHNQPAAESSETMQQRVTLDPRLTTAPAVLIVEPEPDNQEGDGENRA